MGQITFLIIAGLPVLVVLVLLVGHLQWRRFGRTLRGQLAAVRTAPEVRNYGSHELGALPAPVQRYFRTALSEGQPIVTAIAMTQMGMLNVSESGENWRPFVATQRSITRPPGFDWDASIKLFPGVKFQVHDAFIKGEGILRVALSGIVPLAHLRGGRELNEGELLRFLAEAVWYPTALLPSQGVVWREAEGNAAEATLRDGATTVTALFRFSDDGLIASVHAAERARSVDGRMVPTPWEGHWLRYEEHGGMRVPVEGEVGWITNEGYRPYWRGCVKTLDYEVA